MGQAAANLPAYCCLWIGWLSVFSDLFFLSYFATGRAIRDQEIANLHQRQLDQPENAPYGDKINARFHTGEGQVIPVEVCPSRFEYHGPIWTMMVVCDTRHRNDIHRFYYDRENERKHMAREIYDELGQHLTSLRVGISLLGQNHPALQHEVEPLTQLVDGTIKVVRDIATQLRPAVLNIGLKPALIWLRDQFNKHRSGVCTLTIQPLPVSLCNDEVKATFRVVQESLTNVQRHAGAREVEVKVLTRGKIVLVYINDDGQGFDPGLVSDRAFGLLSMRERCVMRGWLFNINSTPGKGSCVHIEIPFSAPGVAKAYDSE